MTPVDLGFLNSILIYIGIIIGIANISLLIGLIYFYKESYKALESKFTIGLLYFTYILLIGNILAIMALALSLVLGIEINDFHGTVVYSIIFLINAAQLTAFSILFKITWD